ncbi:MAG: GNAT family N-acetyltransferase [Pseudomonadota bacterium]
MSNNAEIAIRPVRMQDRDGWAALRRKLFPNFDPPEIDEFFKTGCFDGFDQCAVFVADAGDALVGFAEASARPYAEGCATTPVAYLEAWYVDDRARGKGVGKRLVTAVEDWGRSQGFQEIASDTQPENTTSRKAHAQLGFEEIEQIVCFAKAL